jgi:hypothetical protein
MLSISAEYNHRLQRYLSMQFLLLELCGDFGVILVSVVA